MNPTLILIIVLAVLSILEFVFKETKTKEILYFIGFSFFYFIVAIKYYYGSDISTYVPYYERINNPIDILNSFFSNTTYEPGFELFCSVLRSMGVSFWLMTFIITSFYFYAIYKVFKYIKVNKVLALLVLVYFEYNLLFFEFRQSISISFFILGFLSYTERKYWKYVVFTLLACSFHKSGIYISILSLISMNFIGFNFNKKYYLFLLILLLVLIFVKLNDVFVLITKFLPLNKIELKSISHHLLQTNNIQIIAALYFITIYTIYFCSDKKTFDKKWHRIMSLFFFMIVVLYQDFFLLNRLRSFFIPIAIVYVINMLQEKNAYGGIIYKQVLVLIFYIISITMAIKLEISEKEMASGVSEYTTIFELIDKPEWQIKQDKLKKSEIYWKKDYLKKQ